MANQKSFSEVLSELKKRKEWEDRSINKFNNKVCKKCRNKIIDGGVSKISGICVHCVNELMNPED